MSNELTTTQSTTAVSVPDFLSVIARAASDPNVDPSKMMGLLDVQERMMNKQAEIDFNVDFTSLQAELPRIKKDAKIIHVQKDGTEKDIASYATYETIDAVIRPLLIQYGFGLRFNTRTVEGRIIVTGTLSHKGGHSITDEIPLAIDSSGAKNNVQGVGSTIAYGKRYLVGMLLNIVFEGEDDDGAKAGFLRMTDEQAAQIKDLLRETGSDVARFLKHYGANSVDEMDGRRYSDALNALTAKKERMGSHVVS